MNPNSKINKGKRYEKHLAGIIESMGFGRAIRSAGSGNGNRDKGDLICNLPFLIEAKNHDTLHVPAWIDQAKRQAQQGNWSSDKWAVVFRDFRQPETTSDDYVVISFTEFLTLLKKDSEPRTKAPDREMKWKLQNLKTICGQLIKELEG